MTKIDNQFMEKLGEVLYDEKNAINYKMVSIMFGVHVNIAKQMLYHFYTTNKDQGKKIHATYYLSGMVTWKTLCSMSPGANRDTEENKKRSPDSESYLVLLCKDKDLEEYKAKFTRLFSIHVYALSSFPLENYDVLERLVEQPLVDNKGRTPLDFGPITCSESEKLLESPVPVLSVPVVSNTARVKEDIKKTDKERSSAPADNKGNKNSKEDIVEDTKKSSVQKTQKAAITIPGGKAGGNRLKNMFATAAAKPKVEKVEAKPKPAPKEVQKQPSKASNKSDSKARDSESRKRKRIRDVFSSSESEDEKKSDDEDSLPESPIPPKKRIQIDSDSEEDFKEVPKSGKDNSVNVSTANTTNQKPLAPGRRRVTKMVSETRVTEDGFLVTEKKQVLVSEDEDAEGEKDSKVPTSKKPIEVKKMPAIQPSKPASTSKPLSGKTKQPSVMSFFQKK